MRKFITFKSSYTYLTKKIILLIHKNLLHRQRKCKNDVKNAARESNANGTIFNK